MLRNYLRVALRALRRQPAYAAVNVFGLALGLAFCTLIALFIADEFSYDRFHDAPEQVYRLHRVPVDPDFIFGASVNLPFPLGPALVEDFDEVEAFARFHQAPPVLVFHEGQTFEEANYAYASGDVFDVLTFPFVAGNPDTALDEPMSVVLTEPTARRFFGDADPLNRTLNIRLLDRAFDFRVTGVTEAVPANSSVQFDFLLSSTSAFQAGLSSQERAANWGNSWPITYVRLADGADIARVRAQMPGFMQTHLGFMFDTARERGLWDRPEAPFLFHFQPLLDIHLKPDVPGGMTAPSSPTRSYLLGSIALAILLIACINFMTLAVGRSVRRAKEVGVRKAMGAHRAQIRAQFWGEAFLLTACALLLGLALAAVLLPAFNALTGKALALSDGGGLLVLVIVGLLGVTGTVAGSYPALVLSRLRPIEPLRGRLQLRGPGRLTKGLVAVQFTLSIFLIIATLGVARQLDYLLTKDLGYDGDQLVAIPAQGMPGDQLLGRYRTALAGDPHVVALTGLNNSFGRGRSRRGMQHNEQVYEPVSVRVEHGFLGALGMTLVDGRVFDANMPTDSTESVVVNEAFVRTLGLTDPVGHQLTGLEWGRVMQPTIIGVVADFHVESLRNEVRPTVLTMDPGSSVRWVMARLTGDDLPTGIARLEGVWQTVAPDLPFDYSFVDEDMAALYAEEERWSRIVRYGAFFAILVACLGLFGLAALAVTARTKEIGVRKVLGASAPSLAALLTRDFVLIVLGALALATPAAYVTLRRVLADYPYQARLPWWLFAGAGALALAAALLTVGCQTFRAAQANPVDALRYE